MAYLEAMQNSQARRRERELALKEKEPDLQGLDLEKGRGRPAEKLDGVQRMAVFKLLINLKRWHSYCVKK